jgi:hypothetical protein
MTMDYTLNANAAKKADNMNSPIVEKGRYLGHFTRAEATTSTKGTTGIDFSFAADDGQTANYLTVWTHNNEAKELPGYNLLMAIMTCLRIKAISPVQGTVKKYDRDLGTLVEKTAQVFPDLTGKPIGLLIYMEEYKKNNGDTAWKPVISAPYDAHGFTASEILSQAKTSGTLEKMEKALRDRPMKKANTDTARAQEPASNEYKGPFDDMSDDIPF